MRKSFDNKWEELYTKTEGKHLNRYPYGQLVTHFFRNLKRLPNKNNPKILELGCGAGNNLLLPLNEGFETYGVDGSQSVINIAKKRLSNYNNLTLEVMDFTNLNFSDNYFDMIIDRQSICANKLESISKIFSEVRRVLKMGGIFEFYV